MFEDFKATYDIFNICIPSLRR